MNQLPTSKNIVLLCALEMEMIAIAKALHLTRKGQFYTGQWLDFCVHGIVTGPGEQAASQAFNQAIKQWDPELTVITGFAGGLDKKMELGWQVPICTITNTQHQTIVLTEPYPIINQDCTQFPSGQMLLTTPSPVFSPQEKQALHEQYHAAAVDMETFAVAKCAAEQHKRLMVLRTISDTAEMSIASWATTLIDSQGRPLIGRAIGMAIFKPWRLMKLIKLGQNAKQAANSLTFLIEAKLAQWVNTP